MAANKQAENKRILEAKIETVRSEIEALQQRLQTKGDYGTGKGDPLVVDWELNLARLRTAEGRLEELEAALERLDEGAYGVCSRCGRVISAERLAVLPRTSLCVECAAEGSS
jgi:DnaK suppressor protein